MGLITIAVAEMLYFGTNV